MERDKCNMTTDTPLWPRSSSSVDFSAKVDENKFIRAENFRMVDIRINA